MKSQNPFKKSTYLAVFYTITLALLFGSCTKESDGSGFDVEAIKPITVDVKADQTTTVGSLNENGYQLTIPAGTFGEDVTVSVNASASNVESAIKKFKRLASPISISVEGKQGTVWLNEKATVSFPVPKGFAVTPENMHYIFVSYYNPNTRTVEHLYPDMHDLFQGRITLSASHFSDYCPVLLEDTEACTKFALDRAVGWYEENKKMEDPITAQMMKTSFNDIYAKMGITDESAKNILINGALAEGTLSDIALSLEAGDIGSAGAKMADLAGNVLLDLMHRDPNFKLSLLNKNPAIIQGVVNAGAHLINGDYADAGKAVAEAILDIVPATQYVKLSMELINYAVMSWKKNDLERLYNAFREEGVTSISPADWTNETATRFAGIDRQMGIDAVKLYCKVNNISESMLTEAESDRLKAAASNDLRKAVENRLKEESQIKKKQDEYLDIIRHFKSDGLLDYLSPQIPIDTRLGLFFKIREKILRVVGGVLKTDDRPFNSTEDNLRWATEEYLQFVYKRGSYLTRIPGGEQEFYDWLVQQGFIKAEEKINLAECFGAYEGQGKLSTFTSVNNNISESNTQTMTLRVIIEDMGQGKMRISLGGGNAWQVTGTIAAEGTVATFSARFNPADVVNYASPGVGVWSGTIRKVDNKLTLIGSLEIDMTWETTRSYSEYTFTNFTKR